MINTSRNADYTHTPGDTVLMDHSPLALNPTTAHLYLETKQVLARLGDACANAELVAAPLLTWAGAFGELGRYQCFTDHCRWCKNEAVADWDNPPTPFRVTTDGADGDWLVCEYVCLVHGVWTCGYSRRLDPVWCAESGTTPMVW